jgi:hypothetical protein
MPLQISDEQYSQSIKKMRAVVNSLVASGKTTNLLQIFDNDFVSFLVDQNIMTKTKGGSTSMKKLIQLVMSDNFDHLLKTTLKASPIKHNQLLGKNLLELLPLPPKLVGGLNITAMLKLIHDYVVSKIKNKHDSLVLFKAQSNVFISEQIVKLHLDSFKDLLGIFYNFKYFNKDSASNSVIMTAQLKHNRALAMSDYSTFYFKFFTITKDTPNEGLVAEYQMYEQLFKLSKCNITPNILCKVFSSKLPKFSTDFYPMLTPATQAKMHKTKRWDQTGVIITHPGGEKFGDVFDTLSKADRKAVLFQLFYTLHVFEKLQISHGDMHTLNLFVNDLPEPTEMCFIINKQKYQFTTRKLLKIFDFDFGAIFASNTLQCNDKVQIQKVVNINRLPGNWLNNTGTTHIFNENLDLCVVFGHLIKELAQVRNDAAYHTFVRTHFSAYFDDTHTLRDTYTDVIENPDEYDYDNMLRIFDKKRDVSRLSELAIAPRILDMTWKDYFKSIYKHMYNRLAKEEHTRDITNNQLWVPEQLISRIEDMLQDTYFSSFKTNKQFDMTTQNVYTLAF